MAPHTAFTPPFLRLSETSEDSGNSHWRISKARDYTAAFNEPDPALVRVTMQDGILFIQSNSGAPAVRLWPESRTDVFVRKPTPR